MAHPMTGEAVRVLLITDFPDVHQLLASELLGQGIAVVFTRHEPVVARELRRQAAMVLVDLSSANTMSPALVRRLNSRRRHAPVVGLFNGRWPGLGASASGLRVDGLARSDESRSIAQVATAAAHGQAAPSVH